MSIDEEKQTVCPLLARPHISFSELESLEIEGRCLRMFYKSFFVLLRSPEIIIKSFWLLLKTFPKEAREYRENQVI